ncbi:MAG: ribose-5-phosphate isomerase RpiA [Anaerolineae bacterium]|nr:ribose-5-phosphate isomerase RpiA [Anaerolineae bacterium]
MSYDTTALKRQAAERAVEFVRSGMIVGLGHGSTAVWAVRKLAEALRAGRLENILGVPCSKEIEAEARSLSIPLTTLDDNPVVDLTIDGADEVAPNLDVIKGGGGALLREKIVAQASRREIIVVDETKLSRALGTLFAVPVEAVAFGLATHVRYLESLGAQVTVRHTGSGEPFRSNQGNAILDCAFGPIADPIGLAAAIKRHAGIVEHGLFLGLASDVIVAGPGGIRHLSREGNHA